MRPTKPSIIASLLTLAAGCATSDGGSDAEEGSVPEARSVKGQLTYRERVALRPGNTATVSVIDYAVADRVSDPLAERTLKVGRTPPPIPFEVDVAADSIDDRVRPGLRAVIRDAQGDLVFTTDTVMPISFEGGVADVGAVTLVRAASAPDGEPDARTADYVCGGTPVRVRYEDGRAILLVGPAASPARYELARAPAASGTLYEIVDGKGRVAFRTRGDEARLSVYGKTYPACASDASGGAPQAEASDDDAFPDLTGDPWMIEDVVGMGVVDASAPSIRFGTDGALSGRTGCNDFSGTYELNGRRLKIGPVALTRKMCPEALMRQERRVVGVLNGAAMVAVSEEGAVVVSAADYRSITLRRRPSEGTVFRRSWISLRTRTMAANLQVPAVDLARPRALSKFGRNLRFGLADRRR